MKTILTILILLVTGSLFSCQQDDLQIEENKPIVLDEKSAQLIEADNAFGLEIFGKIRKSSDEENIMISPLSISLAFAMAYNGADADTKAEMEEALKINGLTTAEINEAYKMLIKGLQSLDKDVVFEIANAIFYANGFSVKPGFLETNKNIYDAKVEKLDFMSPSAVNRINEWVAQNTNNKITEIIRQLNPLDRLVLLNAIYFNGIWTNKFDENGTKMSAFSKEDGSVNEIPMMSKEEKLEYTSNDLFSAVKIPYGNGQYNMVVLLPEDGKTSGELIGQLSADNWKNWMNTFETRDPVVVKMPRFKFEFETKLKDVLVEMGMEKAFQPEFADFSKMSDEDLYISSAVHKSFIDVNENGTEAAAVTAITFSTTSIGVEPPKTYFIVNKPFVFAITEKDTGAILFLGEVKNPVYD
jgi:serpin B